MNELQLLNQENQTNTIDSREVAVMLGKEHKEVMRTIKGDKKTIGILPTLESGGIDSKYYFIPSTFINSQNKNQPCFLITKLGCELIGARLQGKKGVLFTTRFKQCFNELSIINSLESITKDFKYIKRKEEGFLDQLEESLCVFNLIGVKQYIVKNDKGTNYRIDYYIPSLNIAIEYDENNHSTYTYEQQEGRQKEIEDKLGCKFIRVSDKNSNGYNIGQVIKEIYLDEIKDSPCRYKAS